MASFTLKLLCCFIVAIFCFNNLNVEAREGKLFFSKFTHLDHSNNKKVAQPPELAQTNGPFGPGSGMIPQTKESWPVSSITTDSEFEKLMDTLEKDNELPKEFEEDEEGSLEDVNEEMDKYNSNRVDPDNENMRSYGKEEERQGMSSDTRFMENGKYFYDTRGKSYDNGYESARGNHHPNEFETMDEYCKSLEGSQEEYEP